MEKVLVRAAVATGMILLSFLAGWMRGQQEKTQTQRIPQLENEDVKVWRSVILPKQLLTMHRHDHPRVIVALKGGTVEIVDDSGARERHAWETGKAYWLPANPPNRRHADVNTGDQPVELMVVELEKEK